jgi:hypothetical protein
VGSQSLIDKRIYSAVLVAATALALLRQQVAQGSISDSVWAEDGWMPLCVVANGHGACLGDQVNGYWPVFHRVLAEAFALVPMSIWPWLFPVIGALLAGGVALATFVVLVRMANPFFAGLAALSTVLIPFMGMEYINVVGNIHWSLLIIAMLTILSIGRNDDSGWVHVVVLFSAGLANPASFVLIGYVLVLAVFGLLRRRTALVFARAASVGWIIQVGMIGLFGGADRVGTSFTFEEKLTAFANSSLGIIPGLRAFGNTPVSFLSVSTRLLPILVVVGMFAVVGWLILDASRSEITRRLAAFGLAVQVLGAFLLLILDESPRYVYVVVALNSVWMIGMVGVSWNPGRISRVIVIGVCAALWLPGFAAGPYRTTPSEVSWQDQLNNAQSACLSGAESVTFHFAPERSYETEVSCRVFVD